MRGLASRGPATTILGILVLVTGLFVVVDAWQSRPSLAPPAAERWRPRSVLRGAWHAQQVQLTQPVPRRSAPGRGSAPRDLPPGTDPRLQHPPPGPTPSPNPSPPTDWGTHRVVRGETPWAIAQRYLGRGELWIQLQEANPGVDFGSLKAGTVLRVPGGRSSVPGAGERSHQILEGESLSRIALLYYLDGRWEPIYEANRALLKSPDDVRTGVRIRIPSRGKWDRT